MYRYFPYRLRSAILFGVLACLVSAARADFGIEDSYHGQNGWVLDWTALGYAHDPFGHFQYRWRRSGKNP